MSSYEMYIFKRKGKHTHKHTIYENLQGKTSKSKNIHLDSKIWKHESKATHHASTPTTQMQMQGSALPMLAYHIYG